MLPHQVIHCHRYRQPKQRQSLIALLCPLRGQTRHWFKFRLGIYLSSLPSSSHDPPLLFHLALPAHLLALSDVLLSGLCLSDERDRVQKKTFTKWVNKHLIKVRSLCQCVPVNFVRVHMKTVHTHTLSQEVPTLISISFQSKPSITVRYISPNGIVVFWFLVILPQ